MRTALQGSRVRPPVARRAIAGLKRWAAAFCLGSCVLTAALATPAIADEASALVHQRVQRAYDEIRARYPAPIDEEAISARAIEAMLRGLDPYSVFLDRDAYRALQQQAAGTYVGLGVEVVLEDNALTIRNRVEDAPAALAGLRVGDRITTLDGVSVAGLTLEQALQLARGAADTELKLTVIRLGQDVPFNLTLTRTYVPQATVKERRLERDVAYVRIERFQPGTPRLLATALQRLAEQSGPAIAGLILDLRDNPGGSVRAAVGVAAAFLPERALVVAMDGPSIGADAQLYATPDGYSRTAPSDAAWSVPAFARTAPMVILIDGGSASAAEIVAGALQDHGRALLVGARTYGKGLVQSIVPLGDGTALKLTVAHYRTPAGRVIQSTGIAPDVSVPSVSGNAEDHQLNEALRIVGTVVVDERRRDATNGAQPLPTGAAPLPVAQPAKVSHTAQ